MEKPDKGARSPRLLASKDAVSAKRKTEAVVRLFGGESPDEIAQSLGVSAEQLEYWRREFIIGGTRRMDELPLGWFERICSPFERLVPLATLLSVAIGAVLFFQSQQKEAEQREKEAAHAREVKITESFNALDDKYIEYVKLCLQHPDLDVFDTPLVRAQPASLDQKRRESMMFAILLSVLERSYLMYRDQDDPFKKEQWAGWEAYLRNWMGRANFVGEYQRTRKEFDPLFVAYMDKLIPPPATQASK